jgi:hypothetical protein
MYSHNENFYSATPSSINSVSIVDNISKLYSSGNFNGINGRINNFIANDISANIINTNNLNSSEIISSKVCFDASGLICLDKTIINNFIDLQKPLFRYMYLPNESSLGTVNDCSSLSSDKIGDGKIGDGKMISALNTTFDMTYSINKWDGKYIYRTVNGTTLQSNGTGIKITVPQPPQGSTYDYEVLWIQTLNDRPYPGPRWSTFKVYQNVNNTTKYFGSYATGNRLLNNISPDGSIHNERWDYFEWYPVPINLKDSREIIISNFYSSDTWYSGFAFSSNPWKHCRVSAISVHWQTNISSDPTGINNTNPAIGWNSDNNNNDPLGQFIGNTSPEIRIPFVKSERNKIFYIIEHNSTWGPSMISIELKKDGVYTKIGNLYTTFNNPFARHFNSKPYQRYYGMVIPKDKLIGITENFMTLRINVPLNNYHFYFREVGTHDEILI